MKRTKEAAELTREKILLTTIELINEKGFEKSHLVEIAKRSSLSRGAIYHHFIDKEGLIAAIFDRYTNKTLDIFEKHNGNQFSSVFKVKNALNELIDCIDTDLHFKNSMKIFIKFQLDYELKKNKALDKRLKRIRFRFFRRLAKHISDNKDALFVNSDLNIKWLILSLDTIIIGFLTNWLINKRIKNPKLIANRFIDNLA